MVNSKNYFGYLFYFFENSWLGRGRSKKNCQHLFFTFGVRIAFSLCAALLFLSKGFWEYFECGVHVSIGDHEEYILDEDDYDRTRSNLFFGCLSTANGLRNAFVLVQISRFQQIIGVYTLQAPTEAAKVCY